jgi:hypothetical protein
MTPDRDFDRVLDRWMDVGPTAVSDRVIAAAMTDVQTTTQRGRPRLPRRILAMTSQTIRRPHGAAIPVLTAAAVLAALVVGTYLVMRPDVGIGDPPSPPTHDEEDAGAAADAPTAIVGLTAAEVPRSAEFMVSGSAVEALHITMDTSRITHSGDLADEEARIEIMTALYTGLESAETRFYDATDSDGTAMPVTVPGGTSIAVVAATYEDTEAAAAAFPAYVAAYETWDFDATEAWSHADDSVAFTLSPMDRAHARCAHLRSPEPCPTALRTWRDGNLVVTLIQQGGDAGVGLDELVTAIEAAIGSE